MMRDSLRKILFKGKEYFLIDTNISSKTGAIATKKQYVGGEASYAHLGEDGTVMRYGEKIGTVDDIEFKEITEIDIPNINESCTKLLENWSSKRKGWRW